MFENFIFSTASLAPEILVMDVTMKICYPGTRSRPKITKSTDETVENYEH
jgi:hypothetical protein